MDIETFKKGKQLMRDIELIDRHIEDCSSENISNHWIAISTANIDFRTDSVNMYSYRFQRELRDWMLTKKEQYIKEFDELA